jgi:hypothetical protein
MLVRAGRATGDLRYREAADRAFESMWHDVSEGGVLVTDDRGDLWIEEYIVDRPSHILNGFMWALWGVRDYADWTGVAGASNVWRRCVATLQARIGEFDTGWWSLYEARDNGLEMLASRYYHTLHITQLRVMHRLTGIEAFSVRADRFQQYLGSAPNRARALARKIMFKLRHY